MFDRGADFSNYLGTQSLHKYVLFQGGIATLFRLQVHVFVSVSLETKTPDEPELSCQKRGFLNLLEFPESGISLKKTKKQQQTKKRMRCVTRQKVKSKT